MARSPLWGRRIHIAGSVHPDPTIAAPEEVAAANALLVELVPRLVARGAGFVIPVDAEKHHPDGRMICFDWPIWEALSEALHSFNRQVLLPFLRDYEVYVLANGDTATRLVKKGSNKVFIVHGHDEAALHGLARFVERLGLEGDYLEGKAQPRPNDH